MAGQAAVTIRGKQWSVSLAVTPWELTQGLGGVPGMPVATGMLFDMGVPQTIQVTTVPMLFPLDIAFLSDTLEITEIYRDIQPGYLVTSTMQARYFLEVNAGDLEGIDAGDSASVEVLAPAQAAASDWTSALFGFMGFMIISIFTVSLVKDMVKGMFGEPKRESSEARTPTRLPKTMTRAAQAESAVWVRYGDVSHYFDFDSPYDAGRGAGIILALYPPRELSYHYVSGGVEVKPFYIGRNYIHLFWGDEKAQWIRDLSEPERKEFERGVRDALASVPGVDGCHASQEFLVQKVRPDSSLVAQLLGKWKKAKVRNSTLALKDLEMLGSGYDTDDCKQALLDYREIEPSDYGDREEYQEARDEAWNEFLECLESLAGEEEETVNGDKIEVVIVDREPQHKLVKIYKRGRVYAATYAEPFPTKESALADYLRNPRNFKPFDESSMTYLPMVGKSPNSYNRPPVIPVKSPKKGSELEYLADSPEFLTQTIEDTGYRDRIDSAFQKAIARARQEK